MIDDAVAVLRGGGLVAFPTETVYGLGADALNVDAVHRCFAVKGRPADHPVIVHLGDPEQLDDWALDVSDAARTLANTCWPGPLTIVVPRHARVPDAVTGGRGTVAIRVPAHPLALELLEAFGSGVIAPSANRFGRVSPTTADHVRADLNGDVNVVLDGGPCAVGVESTVVDCSGDELVVLRRGGVGRAEIERLTGTSVREWRPGDTAAPGTLASHYAPRAEVRVVTQAELAEAQPGVGVLAMNVANIPEGVVALPLPATVEEYARDLYARFREADQHGLAVLLVVPPPEDDALGSAVADRVRRAAAKGNRA